MKYLILMALLCAGCAQQSPCLPCAPNGFMYANGLSGQVTQCIPCSEAKSPEARFVCFGEKVKP